MVTSSLPAQTLPHLIHHYCPITLARKLRSGDRRQSVPGAGEWWGQ